MAGPWDDFAPVTTAPAIPPNVAPPIGAYEAGPWGDFSQPAQVPQQQSVPLPPERPSMWSQVGHMALNDLQNAGKGIYNSVYNAVTLPGNAVQEATQPRPQVSDSDVSVVSPSQAMNFATVANPVSAAARAGELGGTLVKEAPPVPSAQALKAEGGSLINQAKNSGFEAPGSAISDWAQQQQQALFDRGVHPTQAGNTYAQLSEVANAPPGATFTAANLQALRESLAKTAQNFNPNFGQDKLAATQSIKGLDAWLSGLDPKSVVAGDPAATAALFQQGRGNYAAAMSSNDLTGALDRARTGILDRAEGRAEASHSGLNLDNTIRQKAESLLEKPKEVSGLSDASIEALGNVVSGGGRFSPRNTARYVGNLFGGGGGIGHAVIGGMGGELASHLTGGSPYLVAAGVAVPPALGTGARLVANTLAKRSLNKADEVVRAQSPMYQEMLANAPSVPAILTAKQAIARALMPYAFNQVGQGQQ